jgi:excisionase family DNA binding protein
MINTNLKSPLYSLTIEEYIELNKQIYYDFYKSHIQNQEIQKSENEFIAIQEASKILNLKLPTIYNLTSKNLIIFYKRGKKILFKKSDLHEFIEKGRMQTVQEIEFEINKGRTK